MNRTTKDRSLERDRRDAAGGGPTRWTICVVAMAFVLNAGGMCYGLSFTNRATVEECQGILTIGTWAAKALEERYVAIGESKTILPRADTSQEYLRTIKEHIRYLTTRYVCQTNAPSGDFRTYFSTPLPADPSSYPTMFPMWSQESLVAHVGAPVNWFEDTPWRPKLSESKGWLYVSNMISALRWTCRSASDARDRQEKYSVGYSNSYGEAVANERADWGKKSYQYSSRSKIYAAAVVVNAYKNGKSNPPYYYVNGFRLFAKPELNNIPTTFAHRVSWYVRFEQVDGYTSTDYDHPYYNEDNSGGLSVDKPHMVYIEEKPVSRLATELGEYPFWNDASTDPSVYGYVPDSSYISLVKYVCCNQAHWLIKWDVESGFQYR